MYEWAEFRHFRYLIAILEKRGLRAAAEELHTAQPSLSVQARQFQENAGVCLYRKTKAGHIRVTEAGVAFIALAKYLLEVRDEVIEAIRAISRGEITSLRCGSSSLVDQDLFQTLCSMHMELVPSATVRPTHGDVSQFVEEIRAGLVDIALVTLPLDHPELHIEEVRRDRLVVCCRRDSPLAGKNALQLSDLQDHLRVFYSPQRHPDAHDRLIELLAIAGVEIREYLHFAFVMSPLQRYYLPCYVETGFLGTMRQSSDYQLVTVADRQHHARPVTQIDVQPGSTNQPIGKPIPLALSQAARDSGIVFLYRGARVKYQNRPLHDYLRRFVYDGNSFLSIFRIPLWSGLAVFLLQLRNLHHAEDAQAR